MILLTGATGYVGGRLLHRFEAEGRAVHCLTRRPEHLRGRATTTTAIVRGDVLDRASLDAAMRGISTAYYLVHSMADRERFEDADREAARTFGDAARAAGVRRIVYLGGLGDPDEALSTHLRSRHETGAILRESGVPVLEFRASIVIGGGSLSFEMIRALVERLPIMITPRWVEIRAQPIAIGDVLAYLTAALDLPGEESRIFEIGGPDVVSYGDLTPRLSSLWLGLVTPVYARVGRALVDSIRHPTVVRDDAARRTFAIAPIGVRDAIALALRNEDRELAETRWTDARSVAGPERQYGGVRFGNRLVDTRSAHTPVPPGVAFRAIERVGGATGWYYANGLWTLRGWLDLLVGGVGMRRGRRDPDHLVAGDVVDCWRVEAVEPERRLRLQAEMKLPGRAWLTFDVEPEGTGSRITQTATFDPIGLAGLAYWYGIWPLHEIVFRGMLRGVVRAASRGRN
jgi:uncharacterized protein YbjT (DUF2867 family)